MASHAKAKAVEESLAIEFHGYITGSAVIPDQVHGFIVTLYRTPSQPDFGCPPLRRGVKIVVKITNMSRKVT
jgi:hypothetical protein